MQCSTEAGGVDLCKDYAVDQVKCKNLKYQTYEYPKWECDFKFKVKNVAAFKYEVKYNLQTYDKQEKPSEYCYIKGTPYLDYSLVYLYVV